jgi:hypothetical protein
MSATLFQLAFLATVPFWALMILAPAWRWTHRIVSSPFIVLPTLVVWAVAIAPVLGDFAREMLNPDLAGVKELLLRDEVVAAVWAQVIAWDLFIGRWIYLDSRARGLHPLLMAPVLVLTVLLSPIGLPVYFLVRLTGRPRTSAVHDAPAGEVVARVD